MNDSIILVTAIRNLRPGSEFVFENNDYDTIQWHALDGEAPTKAEVDAEVDRVREQFIQEQEQKEARRAEILERLGLTEDEAKLILG